MNLSSQGARKLPIRVLRRAGLQTGRLWDPGAGHARRLYAAAAHFLDGWDTPLSGLAGMIATVTSLNTALLSSARVALALGRDDYPPAFLSRAHPRLKTPVPTILISGAFIALAAASGDEVFLSYVSTFGYMFVVFFINISVILLRR